MRESLEVPAEVRTWQEHEDPLALVAGWLRDRKLATGPVGIEETVRFFAVDGLRGACRRRRSEARRAGRARLPDDQVAGRDRADAAGHRHHHRRLPPHHPADRGAA